MRTYHKYFFHCSLMTSHGFDGLFDITDAIHLLCDNDDIDLEVYFKLYLLLYEDGTVIIDES